jgi:ubiquinone/menaquinone biosynthesis C-methylase UbiE
MRLGPLEFAAMNNPFRRFIQKYFEFRLFRNFLEKHKIDLSGKCIVDAGCGSGYSTNLIKDEFNPTRLIAFDLMPEQIAIAQKRYSDIQFKTGDITDLELPESSADAVFIFGILHHIPEWKKGLENISKVLKISGVLLVEEPRARFTWKEFEEGIIDSGFDIVGRKNLLGPLFKSFICIKN